MVQIKPTPAGFPSESAVEIMIRPIINSTTDTSCNTYWELRSEQGKILATGNTPITEEEYILWDENNTSLEDIVLGKLGLERAVYVE